MKAIKVSKVDFKSGKVEEMVITKSEIMSVWNKARTAARRGQFVTSDTVVRKALGLIQSPEKMAAKFAEYNTTHKACQCPAGQRGVNCYHRTAALMIAKIERERVAKASQAPQASKAAQIITALGY